MYRDEEIRALILLEKKQPGFVGVPWEARYEWAEDYRWRHTPPLQVTTLTKKEKSILWQAPREEVVDHSD